MSSIIRLHAVSSANNGARARSHLLQIDDFRFLLDVGWDEKLNLEHIHQLRKLVDKVDCVLLSHSDSYHLGALPYLVGKCGLSCPVYATVPVFKMGQMFMYDWYLNRQNSEDFGIFDLDDIDAAFDKILQVEYGCPITLKGRGQGITICAYQAGHTLGGAIWKISKTGEQDIYYAMEHNNKKERHLNGFEYEKIMRPGIFITNSIDPQYFQEKRRKRDDMLLGVMQKTLRSGGNVLIAADTAGRALELVLMIDQMWRLKDSGLSSFALVFLNNVAFNVVEFAKSQINWMSEKLIKTFESQGANPFSLKNVIICHSLVELSQIAVPKVVISSSADLECGFARDLFLQWCQDPRSSVVLTYRTSVGSLSKRLIDDMPRIKGQKMDLQVRQRIKLEGKDLEEYNQKRRSEKRKIKDIEEDDDEIHDKGTSNGDLDDSIVFSVLHNNNFPSDSPTKRRRFDDYGEVIQPEDFKENGKVKHQSNFKKHSRSISESSSSELGEHPTKPYSYTQTFTLNCQIVFIDFEGLSDFEALLRMMKEVQPNHVVLIDESEEITNAMELVLSKRFPTMKISKSKFGVSVDCSNLQNSVVETNLSESILSKLELKKVKDYEVAWIEGIIQEDCSDQPDVFSAKSRIVPALDNSIEKPGPSTPLVLSRLRLSELRQLLAKEGINAEIKDRTIHCIFSDGAVYIQKDPDTRNVHIECDGFPEEYYKIKNIVYSQMAML